MKNLEMVYREILFQALEKGERRFVQKDLAARLGCSPSTVFHALDAPRAMGAIRVGGRSAELVDARKLLLYWATRRRLAREVACEAACDLQVLDMEGQMPPSVVYGAFSAYRLRFGDAPADYDHVYVYAPRPEEVLGRLGLQAAARTRARAPRGRASRPRLSVLASDPFLAGYGRTTTLGQTFADLWSLPQWYAREFAEALLKRLP